MNLRIPWQNRKCNSVHRFFREGPWSSDRLLESVSIAVHPRFASSAFFTPSCYLLNVTVTFFVTFIFAIFLWETPKTTKCYFVTFPEGCPETLARGAYGGRCP